MKRKNILFIMADQMAAPMLPFYGPSPIKLPNLSRLAAQGVVFDSAYCNSPLCAPSRFSLASGQFPSKYRRDRDASQPVRTKRSRRNALGAISVSKAVKAPRRPIPRSMESLESRSGKQPPQAPPGGPVHPPPATSRRRPAPPCRARCISAGRTSCTATKSV